jgi:hypothetical protein
MSENINKIVEMENEIMGKMLERIKSTVECPNVAELKESLDTLSIEVDVYSKFLASVQARKIVDSMST